MAVSGRGVAQPPHPPVGGKGGGAMGASATGGAALGAALGSTGGATIAVGTGSVRMGPVSVGFAGGAGAGGWPEALSSCPSTSFGTGFPAPAGRHHTSDQTEAPPVRHPWTNP